MVDGPIVVGLSARLSFLGIVTGSGLRQVFARDRRHCGIEPIGGCLATSQRTALDGTMLTQTLSDRILRRDAEGSHDRLNCTRGLRFRRKSLGPRERALPICGTSSTTGGTARLARHRRRSSISFNNSRRPVGGIDLHFIHEQGEGPNPMPLLLSHGWPGSIVEFQKIIPMLTDPRRFGGNASDAFTVVAPSLPGYTPSFRAWPASTLIWLC